MCFDGDRPNFMLRVAIIGWGAIGATIGHAILRGEIRGCTLVAVAAPRTRADLATHAAAHGFVVVHEPRDVLACRPGVIVEAASQAVLARDGAALLEAGVTLMAMSAGALADATLLTTLLAVADAHGGRLIVPSGAIGGLDMVQAAAVGQLTDVTVSTVKPPAALRGARYVEERGIDLDAIRTRTLIFDGFADEAATHFPKNLNVSVALSLAGIGPTRTRVRLYVDPTESRNVHEIDLKGDFGEARFSIAGAPHPDNPKTSRLAGLSAVATLRRLSATLQVGT